jgi:hypothetical protein
MNAVNSVHHVDSMQLAPEVQRQQAAKTAQAKPESPPQDSVSLKPVGDQNEGRDSR